MKKILIVFLLISCFFKQGFSLISNNDSLLFFEEKIYRANDNDKNDWLLKKYIYLKTQSDYKNALKTINRIDYQKLDSIQKSNCYFEEALMNFELSNFNESLYNIEYAKKIYSGNYAKITLLETMCFLELGEWQLCKTNLAELYNYFKIDTNKLNNLTVLVDTTYRKNIFASTIIPGLGIALNGKPIKGLASFVLNGAAIIGTVALINAGAYTTSFMWFSNVNTRLYLGNIGLTKTTAKNKKQKQILEIKKQYENHIALLLSKYKVF